MHDPNFPPNLAIRPLGDGEDIWGQEAAIEKYGIAGRVWEASRPMCQYLTDDSIFEPSCSLLEPTNHPRKILELGAGQGLPSVALAEKLNTNDLVVMTDLPEVMPLCRQSIEVLGQHAANIVAVPLAWGGDTTAVNAMGPFTHILMSDLVYFPHLYPLLLHTLLSVSDGAEVIMSYQPRSLELESSFFDAFNAYFQMTPVIRYGAGEAKIFVCRRWPVTEKWVLPDVAHVMNGSPEVIRGRDFGIIDQMFCDIEW